MTVVKSDIATKIDSGTMLEAMEGRGDLKCMQALYTSGGALADNTVIKFFKVNVDANIISLPFSSTDHGTTGDINLGFYKADGSDISDDTDAVDEDALATAIDINAAAFTKTETRYEVKAITTAGKKAWELAGLSAKPSYDEFWICGTLSEATSAAGTLVLEAIIID